MHQYAYGATYAKLNNVDFILTDNWEGTYLFQNQQHKVSEDDEIRLYLNQTNLEFHTEDMQKHIITKYYPTAQRIHPEMDNGYSKVNHPVYFDSVGAYSKHIFAKQSKKHLLEIIEGFNFDKWSMTINEKISKLKRKYYKYKGKYLEMKIN
jgi:hypothetical protein